MYQDFIEYWQERGYEFPCSQWEFIARAIEFAEEYFMRGPADNTSQFKNYESLADAICCQGIGSHWNE